MPIKHYKTKRKKSGFEEWLDQIQINKQKYDAKQSQINKVEKRDETTKVGHVYFYESAGNFKIGKSCSKHILKRVLRQKPDKVITVSKASEKYHKLEKELHAEYESKRMGRYEIFCGLTETEIKKIEKKLGCCKEIVQNLNESIARN